MVTTPLEVMYYFLLRQTPSMRSQYEIKMKGFALISITEAGNTRFTIADHMPHYPTYQQICKD